MYRTESRFILLILLVSLLLPAVFGCAAVASLLGKRTEDLRKWERNEKERKKLLVFVHGFNSTKAAAWENFPELLRSDDDFIDYNIHLFGYPTAICFKPTKDIRSQGDHLASFLKVELPKYESVIFVAHSMGGLVSLNALLSLEGSSPDLLKKAHIQILTFGTPFQGVKEAGLLTLICDNEQAENMEVLDNDLFRLQQDWKSRFNQPDRPQIPIYAYRGAVDFFVSEASACPVGIATECEVVDGDHVSMVKPKNRDHLAYRKLRSRLGARPADIPQADPSRFSVLVPHLENDPNREHERLIVEALKEMEGIQVLALDRMIPLEGSVPEEQEKRGHKSARGYLKESGASVLIWGTVLRLGDESLPKLYWTASIGGEEKPKRYDAPGIETQLRLPELFWTDLAQILRLLAVSTDAEFTAKDGRFVADRLPPFIEKVKNLLNASEGRPGWDLDSRGATRMILANSLLTLGGQGGKNEPLQEAVVAYREALKERTRDRVPLDWAGTQNNLGIALWILGGRESDTTRLEEAVIAYREALKEFTRDRVPLDWAMTQNNLGIALRTLGERENGTARLEEAVIAYREALKEYTRDRVPLDWAMTQNNLGLALWTLVERESGTARLKEWAMTQNNLGLELSTLGERESGTARLEEAVIAYREALKEFTRDRVPLDWAMTQNNLGIVLSTLGERESGTARLEEAVIAYREALKEYTRDRVPLDWAMTQNNLGIVLSTLGERESGTARLEEAVIAYREALKERKRNLVPLDWAMTQNNLGLALRKLGERESGTARLEEAVALYKEALNVFEAANATYYIKGTKANLKGVESLLNERRIPMNPNKFQTGEKRPLIKSGQE